MADLDLRPSRLDSPDAQMLIDEVQAEYVRRYGGPDASPIDAAQFADPAGQFFIGYLDGRPVAMGGWRHCAPEDPETSWANPAAEVKRMYVTADARGAGFARAVLAELERTAAAAGVDWLILGTGSAQPEAIALYRSSGYQPVYGFGEYASSTQAVFLGRQLRNAQ